MKQVIAHPVARAVARNVPYGSIAALAVAGQYMAGVKHFKPALLAEYLGIAGVATGIEGMAIWLAVLADRRARLGERALPYRIISAVFAALAIGINIVGHYGDPYGVAVFAGFSLCGYTVYCLESVMKLRDNWDPDGKIRSRVPAYGLLSQYENDPAVIERARLIAQIHAETHPDAEGLGPVTVLQRAQDELKRERRAERIRKVFRQRCEAAKMDHHEIDLAMEVYDTEGIAKLMIDNADNGSLAQALAHVISPHRLTGVSPRQLAHTAQGGSAGGSAPRPGPAQHRRELPGSPAQQPVSPPAHRLKHEPLSPGSPAHDPVRELAQLPAHEPAHDPAQSQLNEVELFGSTEAAAQVRMAQYWLKRRAAGEFPSGGDLARVGGVSLATGKRRAADWRKGEMAHWPGSVAQPSEPLSPVS